MKDLYADKNDLIDIKGSFIEELIKNRSGIVIAIAEPEEVMKKCEEGS